MRVGMVCDLLGGTGKECGRERWKACGQINVALLLIEGENARNLEPSWTARDSRYSWQPRLELEGKVGLDLLFGIGILGLVGIDCSI